MLRIVEDGPQMNKYWHSVRLFNGELLVADVAAVNTHGQGRETVQTLATAFQMCEALQAIADAYELVQTDVPAPLVHAIRKARAALAACRAFRL